jgi:subfamily B ATP-binding cassette protein MsbA
MPLRRPSEAGHPARRLIRYAAPQRGTFAVAVAAFVLASATEPLIPKLLQIALDDGMLSHASFALWLVPVVLIALFAARGLLGFVGQYMLARATSRAVFALREQLAERLLGAEVSLFTRLPAGVAVNKVISDPATIASHLGGAMMTVLRDGTTAAALLIYLLWLNWQLTLLAFLALPVLVAGVRRVHVRMQKVGRDNYDANVRLAASAEDLVRSWRVIRTFGAGEFERRRFGQVAGDVQRVSLKASAAAAAMTPISQLGASIGVALIVMLAMHQVRSGEATVGSFAGYIAALLLLVSRARHLTDVSQPIVYAMTVARGCFELLDATQESAAGRSLPAAVQGDVAFEQVRVRYPEQTHPVLDGFDLRIRAGSMVALVGSSGGGKSTAIHALLGFVPCESGRILLDGHDIAELSRTSLREQFAVVSQDVLLFDASVADNVVYASARDEARLERCLRAAALWDAVLAMPQGVETNIGTNGSRLSGGQRQRLSIARALYKEAPIWIFDEATSALDSESERAVLGALEALRGRKTLIVIAHRLSTIQAADRIHVLAGGRVVASGTHQELLAREDLYARLVAEDRAAEQAEAAVGAAPAASA